jgi:uncharacterized protein YbjT (DUF2867 family)
MRILVVGASQGTGALAVQAALDKGQQAVAAAVTGHDAVIVTASASNLGAFKENPRYFSQGTGYVLDAMKAAGVRRIVVLSALGVGESRPLVNPLLRALMVDWLLKIAFEDHARQEELVRRSGLDGIIVRPGRLTNGPARRRYITTGKIEKVPSSIARADVADFLVDACGSPSWVGHAVQIGG